MKVKVFPADQGGCGFYRMYWPAEALSLEGKDVRVSKLPKILMNGSQVVGIAESVGADVVVFQRPARPQYIQVFEIMQKMGIKVVVDLDDDLAQIHPMNKAFIPYQQKDMHWRFAQEACQMADLVTCATPALAERYGNGKNSVVIPNAIPSRFLSVEGERDPDFVTVGWAGVVDTHPRDLDITHGSINEAVAKTKGRFLALGDEKALDRLSVRNRAPHGFLPPVGIMDYPTMVAQLDVGIVPLEFSEFNRAKSWLKGLEYASLGVAPVVTPTPDNIRLIEAGAALAANNPADWRETVRHLIENDEARSNLQKAARDFAATQTIEGNAHKWWTAWEGMFK